MDLIYFSLIKIKYVLIMRNFLLYTNRMKSEILDLVRVNEDHIGVLLDPKIIGKRYI